MSLNMECPSVTSTNGSFAAKVVLSPKNPIFALCTAIPEGFSDQFGDAVLDFMHSSNLPSGIDKQGFFYQTLQAIANSAILGQGRELWLGICGRELYTYILASISIDFDGRLTYTVHQAWVREDQRGQPWVRNAWQKVRQRAKDTLCFHFVVHSTKERTDAYCRFLGSGFHKVAEILKQEL